MSRFTRWLAVVLSLYNNLLNLRTWRTRSYVVVNSAATTAVVAAARRTGSSWRTIGLSRDAVVPGVRWASVPVAASAAALALTFATRRGRLLLHDERVARDPHAAAVAALVRIPLGTVLLEEVAFRGVLYGAVEEDAGPEAAQAVQSLVFGLWHIMPTVQALRINGRPVRLGPVLGAVAGTAVAGVFLGELRRRSGGIIAPAIVHWGTNALATLASARAQPVRTTSDSATARASSSVIGIGL